LKLIGEKVCHTKCVTLQTFLTTYFDAQALVSFKKRRGHIFFE
jgi:hypothetical protein